MEGPSDFPIPEASNSQIEKGITCDSVFRWFSADHNELTQLWIDVLFINQENIEERISLKPSTIAIHHLFIRVFFQHNPLFSRPDFTNRSQSPEPRHSSIPARPPQLDGSSPRTRDALQSHSTVPPGTGYCFGPVTAGYDAIPRPFRTVPIEVLPHLDILPLPRRPGMNPRIPLRDQARRLCRLGSQPDSPRGNPLPRPLTIAVFPLPGRSDDQRIRDERINLLLLGEIARGVKRRLLRRARIIPRQLAAQDFPRDVVVAARQLQILERKRLRHDVKVVEREGFVRVADRGVAHGGVFVGQEFGLVGGGDPPQRVGFRGARVDEGEAFFLVLAVEEKADVEVGEAVEVGAVVDRDDGFGAVEACETADVVVVHDGGVD